MRPYCRAGGFSRRIIMRETAGLSTYGLVHRNNSTAGINCVRPPNFWQLPSPSRQVVPPLPKGEALKRSYYMTKRKYSIL
mgnify:CR=1 FL=1